MSPEAIKYYAGWVIKAQTHTQLFEADNRYKTYLYLICFIIFQYQSYQDTLLDVMLKCIKSHNSSVEKIFDNKKLELSEEKDELGQKVLKGFQSKTEIINRARNIIYEAEGSSDWKLDLLKVIIPETVPEQEQETDANAESLDEKLSEEMAQSILYEVIIDKSDSLCGKVADIVKHLDFTVNNEALLKVINHYQTNTKVTKNSPYQHLNSEEYKAVFKGDKFEAKLYKSFLFMHIYESVRNGTISLKHSHKYLPIEDYMINEKQWLENRDHVLERLGLEKYRNIDELLDHLKTKLDPAYADVNRRIYKKENKFVRYSKSGQYIVNTPAIEKPNYDGLAKLFSEFVNIPILDIIRDVDAYTSFTSQLRHYKVKDNRIRPSKETFYAGIFALASNMGAYQLSGTSVGINYDKLSNAITWYFTLGPVDTLQR